MPRPDLHPDPPLPPVLPETGPRPQALRFQPVVRWLPVLALLTAVLLPAAPAAAAPPPPLDTWWPLGPEGGCVGQLETLADGRLLAATCGGALYVSDDGGGSWAYRGALPDRAGTDPFVPDPVDPEVLYTVRDSEVALYRSADLGRTWRRTHAWFGVQGSVELLALPGEPGPVLLWMVAARFGDGLFRSTDGGETWEPTGDGLPPGAYTDLAALPGEPSRVYAVAGEERPVYRSDDGGRTFVRTAGGLPGGRRGAAVAVAPGRPTRLYTVLRGGEVFASDDRGGSWRAAGGTLPVDLFTHVDLGVHPSDPETVHARVGARLLVSSDGAGSFRPIHIPGVVDHPAVGPPVSDYLALPTPGLLWVTPDPGAAEPWGVARSRDGGRTWDFPNRGLHATTVRDLAAFPDQPVRLYAATADRLLRLAGSGGGWGTVAPLPGQGLAAPAFLRIFTDPGDGRHLVAAAFDALYESRDGGSTWQRQGIGCLSPRTVAFLPGGGGGLVASGGYQLSACGRADECALFRRDGFGAEWRCIRGEPRPNAVLRVAAAPRTETGRTVPLYAVDREVFASGDGGATWAPVPLPPGVGEGISRGVSALALHPLDPDELWIGLDDGEVWHSGDGGASWRVLSPPGGWPAEPLLDHPDDPFLGTRVHQLRVDPVEPRRLYVVTGGRLWGSDDGGGGWTLLSEGLPPAPVNDLELDPGDPATLYAAVDGAGVRVLNRRLPPAPCVADATTLCLGEGDRFRVRVVWRDFGDRVGAGRGTERSAETGTFWFFDQDNAELVVKVLDGRPVNGHHWVFYASLSNVAYVLVVTDVETGESQGYPNPEGRFASRGDTAAFPEGVPRVPPRAPRAVVPRRTFVPPAPCLPGPEVLCLAGGRFRVEAEWRDFTGGSGSARVVPTPAGTGAAADTGYLWFFAPGNYELAVKVLDGRPVNGHWWVFYGSLSNVAFTLRVTDTTTGEVLEYDNAPGNFGSRGDTGAFREAP